MILICNQNYLSLNKIIHFIFILSWFNYLLTCVQFQMTSMRSDKTNLVGLALQLTSISSCVSFLQVKIDNLIYHEWLETICMTTDTVVNQSGFHFFKVFSTFCISLHLDHCIIQNYIILTLFKEWDILNSTATCDVCETPMNSSNLKYTKTNAFFR